jgi:hypothetical protein
MHVLRFGGLLPRTVLPVILALVAACTANTGNWSKAGVDNEAREADLLACQAETDRLTRPTGQLPVIFRTARYTYIEPKHGLFGPPAGHGESSERQQIEREIANEKHRRWRAQFGACLESRGYHYTHLGGTE